MSEQRIRVNINDALDSKKYAYFTGTTVSYEVANVCLIDTIFVNKGITGSVTLVDQASASGAATILNDQATSSSVETLVLAAAFLAQPDYPRRIVITPGGTTADVPAGDVVVTGTDFDNALITEAFTFAENDSGAVNGEKRFKTISQIIFPVQDGGSATYDVGERAGDIIGILTDPTVGTEKQLNLPLKEGLSITSTTTTDITTTYFD